MAEERARSVALREIADAAGVSVSTVSRALSGRGDLARGTRERVLDIAREKGYDRSWSARGRPTSVDPRLIELVLGSFDDAWRPGRRRWSRRSMRRCRLRRRSCCTRRRPAVPGSRSAARASRAGRIGLRTRRVPGSRTRRGCRCHGIRHARAGAGPGCHAIHRCRRTADRSRRRQGRSMPAALTLAPAQHGSPA